jgi:hypothetical protein
MGSVKIAHVPVRPRKKARKFTDSEKIWRLIRGPFFMPEGLHRCKLDDWELFDCDAAGCRVCGALHSCGPDVCPLANADGWQVCEITGFCVKSVVFAKEEFVTTAVCACERSAGCASSAPPRRRIEDEQVKGWVESILCSESTREALEIEAKRRVQRAYTVFLKLAKVEKAAGRSPNLISLATGTATALAATRIPVQLTREALTALAAECSAKIMKFCCRFLELVQSLIPMVKMRGFVVGVLYLMRTGLCLCDSVEVLPCVPELRGALPLESQLPGRFRLSTKIITEAENNVKLALRGHAQKELEEMGF